MARPLPFTGPWLLAPMEGVTEPCFRDLVLARNPPHALGGAFTEFVRVVDHPIGRAALRDHLGPRRFPAPVGLQIMGADVACVAETAARAADAGAPLVDLNFGCPAPGALRTCAGSAMLREPAALERMVAAVVDATPRVPVSAKIRAGFDDDALLEDLARAAAAGGASLLTVHCRTRREGYCPEVDWSRIARAVAAVSIPVCGNGGVAAHGDLERLRRETGCAYAMVGRGALADPWIFSGHTAEGAEAAAFLLEYAERMREHGFPPRGVAARVKQLLHSWTAGDLVAGDRRDWLRIADAETLLQRIARAGGLAPRALSLTSTIR